jgi:hypothetical protein
MRFTHITEIVFNYLFGHFLRRAMLAALIGLFALIAIYHFTFAGMLALENQYGLLYARLIVAAVYSVAVLILTIVFWAMRTKPLIETTQVAAAITAPRNTQIAMLIEAVVLGYTLGRKSAKRIR